ncbi:MULTISPECIES: hypothetical protein [Polaribacter]|uniref:Uncharacterized protein n=1 Tax=Polaribacter sejongensis TaxID=985043 RepID=A0AAJ1QYR8_9FLAO|nr:MULTISPECIES: hypothetical protein [Polaribacter]MDN3620632.1 hypothetical protein [Polaribacter undariae]UWD32448.1 hypothetical protein NQP51_01970 [Polaribacter undariae]
MCTYKIFTKQELFSRAEEANRDYLNGNFSTQEDFEKESANW